LSTRAQDADAYHREAIERLAGTRIGVHLARTRLTDGEWLRRRDRRVDARQPLRAAYDAFQPSGRRRSPNEPAATSSYGGRDGRKRTVETRIVLIPKRGQIARLAVARRTNPEIRTQLFISPRTVEYHLAKVFTKPVSAPAENFLERCRKLGLATATT
jgi:DNA-binding CsgD family transcriptional regulator